MLLLLITTIAYAQYSADTGKVWINRQDALKTLAAADSLPSYKMYVASLKIDVDTLNARIAIAKQEIKILKEKGENNSVIIKSLEDQKKILEKQRGILLDEISRSNKQLKKQKRKTFFAALAGVAATVTALFL